MVHLGLQAFACGARRGPSCFLTDDLSGILVGMGIFAITLLLGWTLTRSRRAGFLGRREQALSMSPDTVSSLYPDRPIRPLPKRRLRERLSPEVADSIQYPPTPQNTTPLFYYPYNTRDDDNDIPGSHGRERFSDSDASQGRRTVGTDSDDDDYGARRNVASRPAPGSLGTHQRLPTKPGHGRHPNSQPPVSAGSSADGYYDPFEITNNKKKRKIPSAGDSTLNGSHSLHDGALGSEPPSTPVQSIEGHGEVSSATSTPYYGCGSFASGGQNVSGPGRGRYGRVRNGRSPLRALSDSTNNWAGRNGKLRPAQWTSQTSESPISMSFVSLPLSLLPQRVLASPGTCLVEHS